MTQSRLSSFQRAILEAFFRRAPAGFFLTGGAALAGFHLCHRTTEDLDLFTASDQIEEGVQALHAAAAELDASVEALQTSPHMRRYLLRHDASGVVVDLVFDPVPQGTRDKPLVGSIRVDPPSEILANKLGALLQRTEIRDLVDTRALEEAGYPIEQALSLAMRKDAGLTPAQLAWVLSQMTIGEDTRLPGDSDATSLRRYLADLQARLTRLSRPG